MLRNAFQLSFQWHQPQMSRLSSSGFGARGSSSSPPDGYTCALRLAPPRDYRLDSQTCDWGQTVAAPFYCVQNIERRAKKRYRDFHARFMNRVKGKSSPSSASGAINSATLPIVMPTDTK